MSLAEVLRVGGRPAEAVPVVEDALRRYEHKQVVPAANRARVLLDELVTAAADTSASDPAPVASPE